MADNFWPIPINPMALGADESTLPGGAGWENANLLPIQKNRKTGQWAWGMPNSLAAALSGVMAPGKAANGLYERMIDPTTGVNYYDGMLGDVSNLAGMLTLGSGAIPKPANALNMGMQVFHGSPNSAIKTLAKSERGPLGPGVYATPLESLAKRYAGEKGTTYSFEAPDEIFHGMRPWGSGSDVNPYQIWRDQAASVLKVVPEGKRDEVKALFEKMWPEDGYPFFQRLSSILGSKEDAQALLRKAGYKGITAFVDGPEMALFDEVALP